jgi:jasmonate O-methyltransferase
LRKAIKDVYTSTLTPQGQGIMVVADLGCSSGPNALLVVSEVTSKLRDCLRVETDDDDRRHGGMAAVQFFLNDLPGNDFNLVFRSLENLQNLAAETEADDPELPCYVAGLPGSFYTRLFPSNSVHLFHSSYSLMWQSKLLSSSPNK